jgi:phenylacetate-CoA ligase
MTRTRSSPLARAWNKLRGNVVIAARLRGQKAVAYQPRERLHALRDRRIRDIVAYAARHVPYYRHWFAQQRIDPRAIAGAADLDRLPVLDRDFVRSNPERFLAGTPAARQALSFSTSGTTGTPLVVHHDRRSLLENIAFGEREREPVNRACGGSFRPKELYVGYDTSTFKKVQAFYEESTLLPVRPRRTFVSLLEPAEKIAAIANAERPDILVGYGGWLDVFFRTVAARSIELRPPKLVINMGEALPPGGRELIEATFGIPVMTRYNAVESFKIGYFCEARTGFHIHEDLCHVRVVGPDGSAAAAGEQGRVVISNLINRATVLLNYPIGDVAAMPQATCPCGRTFALMSELEGRVEDVVELADGRVVHPRAIWQVLKRHPEILQYQLVQHEWRRFMLALVTVDAAGFDRVSAQALPELTRLLGGDARIDASRHTDIGRGQGGKFRAVLSLAGSQR